MSSSSSIETKEEIRARFLNEMKDQPYDKIGLLLLDDDDNHQNQFKRDCPFHYSLSLFCFFSVLFLIPSLPYTKDPSAQFITFCFVVYSIFMLLLYVEVHA